MWLAMDIDGEWYVYEKKPLYHKGVWNPEEGSEATPIGRLLLLPGILPKDTLRRLTKEEEDMINV